MFVVSALILKDAIIGYWSIPRFTLIPNTDLKDGSCSTVLIFALNLLDVTLGWWKKGDV